MQRFAILIPGLLWLSTSALSAQTVNPHFAEGKKIFDVVKNNLAQLAEAMPESAYGFQPTPDIRTFAQMVAHVAESQVRNCSAASGQPKSLDAASKTAKAELVAALKESSSMCDAAWDSLTEANSVEMVKAGPWERSRLSTLEYNSVHSNEEYGYMAVYLRLKGIVPPSTANRKK